MVFRSGRSSSGASGTRRPSSALHANSKRRHPGRHDAPRGPSETSGLSAQCRSRLFGREVDEANSEVKLENDEAGFAEQSSRGGRLALPRLLEGTFAVTDTLAEADPEISALLSAETTRQRDHLNLIASENVPWPAVLEVLGSAPHYKYSEGYPGKRYHAGSKVVDDVERLAIDRARRLFGADHANVQPHAGAPANMAVYLACLEPGDTILSMRL